MAIEVIRRSAGVVKYTGRLVGMECPTCGIHYGLPEHFSQQRREDGESWYCPNGHGICYRPGETPEQAARRELGERIARLEREKRRVEDDLLDQVQQRQRAEKARKAVEDRIKLGVCPWCRRSFANVAAHCAAQHGGNGPRHNRDPQFKRLVRGEL